MFLRKLIFAIAFLFTPSLSANDVKKEMLKFLDEIAESSNYNGADIYQGQKAGYVTGGSFTLRSNSVNIQPLTVSLPRYEAGCGGIDLYAGGFSFINDEQLIQALKSVGSASAGYAFLLALETVSPQMSSAIKQMQTWANDINMANIGSCELAAHAVGSVWPKNDIASRHICQTIGTSSLLSTDFVSSRHDCENQESRNKTLKILTDENSELKLNYNIAWDAIKLQGALAKDTHLGELLMTLMGTIVVNGEKVDFFPPKVTEESFLRKLMEGGQNKIYECDDKKQCLQVKEQSQFIRPNEAWAGRVEELLLSIQRKVLNDEELIGPEVELLTRCRIPLYKYISILTAYKKSVCPVEIKQMAEVVAMDILARFIRESLDSIRMSCLRIKQTLPYGQQVDEYVASLDYVESSLSTYELRSTRLMEQEHSIFVKMDMLEKYIAKELHL